MFFLFQTSRQNWSEQECSWLLFSKLHDQMVSFSTKPGDETNETESLKLINKTALAKRWVPKLFLFL